jgi:hypothetical protein
MCLSPMRQNVASNGSAKGSFETHHLARARGASYRDTRATALGYRLLATGYWLLGYSATRLLGYSATRLLGYSATRLLGYSATRLLGYSATRLLQS